MAADAATGVAASPAPATVAAAAGKPLGANSGRRAAGVTASGLLSPPAQKMGARTAASNMTAGGFGFGGGRGGRGGRGGAGYGGRY
jgi:hypothetical protein